MDAREFYGRWDRLYDVVSRRLPLVSRIRRAAVDACRLESGDTVLEVGCGTGANLPLLADAVGPTGRVIGLDYSPELLDRAARGPGRLPQVELVVGDATALPVEGPVDAVLATFVLGMLEAPVAAVDDWIDRLGADGHLVLVNVAESEEPFAPVVNPAARRVVRAWSPPAARAGDPLSRLSRRVVVGHGRLADSAAAVAHERYVLGLVRLTGGRFA